MTSPFDPSAHRDLVAVSRRILDEAWRAPGFCVPHPTVYPHQWLWDSCFHAIAWLHVGAPERGLTELAHALGVGGDAPAAASPGGFVPHMRYWNDPGAALGFWGVEGRSSITQPPMFGHALRCLVRAGVTPDPAIVAAARDGLAFLLRRRGRLADGRVAVVHPWETGCDDSPRWDDGDGPFDVHAWRLRKAELVGCVEADATGVPISSSAWRRGSIGFNALLVWNGREYAAATGDHDFDAELDELAAVVGGRWSEELGIWTDHDGPAGGIVTADACLGLLVEDRPAVRARLADADRSGGAFGPAGVDRTEPIHDPDRYWRGPVWPQLGYLLALAAARQGDLPLARSLADGTIAGVVRSGFSEFWHPDTGAARGATPQTWATIVVALSDPDRDAAGW